jgi:hypothetical protein
MIDESKTTDPVEQHRFYFHINNGSRTRTKRDLFFPVPTTPPRMLLLWRRNWRKARAGVDSSLS